MNGGLGASAHREIPPPTTSLPPWDGFLATSSPGALTSHQPSPPCCPLPQVATRSHRLRVGWKAFILLSLSIPSEGLGMSRDARTGLCLRAGLGGSCPHRDGRRPGRCEPLGYLQSRYQTLPSMEVAISLGTPVTSELGLWDREKRRLVFMTPWSLAGGDPGSWWAPLPSNRVPRHLGEFILTKGV